MRMIALVVLLGCAVSVFSAGMLAPGSGLRGTFYAKPDLSGAQVVRYDAVNVSWKEDAGPVADFKPGAFSVQWHGYLLPHYSETYTFTVNTAGGVRLFIRNKRVIDDGGAKQHPRTSIPIDLVADKLVPIILRVTQPAGAGTIQLQWSSPSQPVGTVPITRLYPSLFAPVQCIYTEKAPLRASMLALTNLTDTPKVITVNGCYKPVLNSDGNKVVFNTVENLAFGAPGIFALDLTTPQQPLRLTRAERGTDKYDPAYSADDRTLVFINQTGTAYEIWTMRANGGNRVKRIADAYENRHPLLTPDGKALIYQSKRDGVWNLFRVNIDGTDEQQLTTKGGTEPAINRRGDKIAFISTRDGRPQLYLMGLDGSNQTLLCQTSGEVSQPFFTPNRDNLAFLEKDAAENTDLYLVDLDDKVPCRVTAHGKIAGASLAYSQELPADDCAFWFSAQDASTLYLDAENRVSTWENCFRTNISAVQPNADRQPIYITNAINGLAALRFDGRDDFMETTIQSTVGEMYAVFRFRADFARGYKALLGNKPGYGNLWFLENNSTCFHHNPYPTAVWKNGTNIPEPPYDLAPLNEWMILTCCPANANQSRIYQISASDDNYFSEFDVAEMIGYRTPLPPDVRTAVITALKKKYGIP